MAAEAQVARKTVADFEAGTRTLHERSKRQITEALKRAGIEFVAEGVQFHGGAAVVPGRAAGEARRGQNPDD